MAINFPNNPVDGNTYTYNSVTYVFSKDGVDEGFWRVGVPASSGVASPLEIDTGTNNIKYVTPYGLNESKYAIGKVQNYKTLAQAVASTSITKGSVYLEERIAGNGGGGMWSVVLASTVTPNTFDIVACTGVPTLALVLQMRNDIDAKAIGAVCNGSTDDFNALSHASTLGFDVTISGDFLSSGDVAFEFKSTEYIANNGSGGVLVTNTNQKYKLPNKRMYFAHRGSQRAALENTMQAMILAEQMGYDGVEIDIPPSGDDTIYLFHNSAVDGVTDGTGTFNTLTDAYIDARAFTLASGTAFAELKIPKFSDFLVWLKTTNMYVFTEITQTWTNAQLDSYVAAIVTAGVEDQVIMFGGTTAYIEYLRSVHPDMKVGIAKSGSLTTLKPTIDTLQKLGNGTIAVDFPSLTAEATAFKEYCDKRGVSIASFTATRVDHLTNMEESNAKLLITDIKKGVIQC